MASRDSQILSEILKLSELISKIDNYSELWLRIRDSKPRKSENDKNFEWYELNRKWQNATEELKTKISRLTKENNCSPILVCKKDKLLLGYDSDLVKGYKIVVVSNLKWFKELNLPIGRQQNSFEKYINKTKQKPKFSEYITEKMLEMK